MTHEERSELLGKVLAEETIELLESDLEAMMRGVMRFNMRAAGYETWEEEWPRMVLTGLKMPVFRWLLDTLLLERGDGE